MSKDIMITEVLQDTDYMRKWSDKQDQYVCSIPSQSNKCSRVFGKSCLLLVGFQK